MTLLVFEPASCPADGNRVVGDEPPPPPPAWLEPYSPDIQAAVSFAGFALAHTIEAGEPPALLFHGINDTVIPHPLAQQTCAAATAVGITCELVTHTAGHAATDAVGNFDDAINRTDAFLRRELG